MRIVRMKHHSVIGFVTVDRTPLSEEMLRVKHCSPIGLEMLRVKHRSPIVGKG